MRLIDADELLKYRDDHEMISTHLIWNAPTIEPNLILPERMERGECYEVGETIVVMNHDDYYDLLCRAMENEPKQGEWKHLKGDEWLCSNCGYVVWTDGSWEHPLERGKDYCEHCGARMKGADDE